MFNRVYKLIARFMQRGE